jgi:hypothetical protein
MKAVRRKPIGLEEARKRGLVEKFVLEHPSKGDADLFRRLLKAMSEPKAPSEDDQT